VTVDCRAARETVAVALLQRQEVPDEVRRHVETCPGCAAEAAGLRPVVDLLATASAPLVDDSVVGSERSLDRLLATAADERHHRRRRRWATTLAAAAVAALVLVGIGVGIDVWRAGDSAPATVAAGLHASARDPVSGVAVDVVVAPTDWGSSVATTVTGVAPRTQCTLVVHTADGRRLTAATWYANYDGSATVNGSVASDVASVTQLDVVDAKTHEVLVSVPLGPQTS
jgi:hypothetical protein